MQSKGAQTLAFTDCSWNDNDMLKNPVNEAVILAAGQGARLGAKPGLPKCLQSVGGRPLLEHQIRTLQHFGVSRILVVIGSEAPCVREWLSRFHGVEYVINERFATTNSLYSLWLARTFPRSDFLLMNCDVLAHPAIYRKALDADGPALMFDSSSNLADEEMKVSVQDGLLRRISKDLPAAESHGENVGMIRFSAALIEPFFAEVDRIIQTGNHRAWAPLALNGLVENHAMPCHDVAGKPWIEIDFMEDFYRACDEVWPSLAESMSAIHGTQTRPEVGLYQLAA
jgi:choline kinase